MVIELAKAPIKSSAQLAGSQPKLAQPPRQSGIKAALKRWFPTSMTYAKSWRLLFKRDSSLVTLGWFQSQLQGHPCRGDGSPLPWMNYSVIHFLETRLRNDLTLFEYGSGYSTLFFGQRVAEVTAVEHDSTWQQAISPQTPANARVLYQALDYDGDYCRAVAQSGQKYDLVVVDGRDRVRCTIQACDCLSPQGVILLDDSDRFKYQAGIQYLRERGFRQLDFRGLKPVDHAEGQTSLFYRPNNCLGI